MPHPNPAPSPAPPAWPHCGHSLATHDPVGCRGINVPGHTACLAHLADRDRDIYLAVLVPGGDIDHRGTTFTEPLLNALLASIRDSETGRPTFGNARFESATFTGHARFKTAIFAGYAGFREATFTGYADFAEATFTGDASFDWTTFTGNARFGKATFTADAWFGVATFAGNVWFAEATFTGNAEFGETTFMAHASFDSATFSDGASFDSATFTGTAEFKEATFTGNALFGEATFMGVAVFREAIFTGNAWFGEATFMGVAVFGEATFTGNAWFGEATFAGNVWFAEATFTGNAEFGETTFTGTAEFGLVTFTGNAGFDSASFTGNAWFGSATFERDAEFELASFTGNAGFESATFKQVSTLGPLVCAGRVQLSGAVFGSPVTLLISARRLECRRTRWSATAELRLRYATVDFAQAVFEYPLTITAEASPLTLTNGQPTAEQTLAGTPDATVRITSMRGVDAAHLVLADVDLSRCLFAGTVHLDQLRLEGTCTFDNVPAHTAWRYWRPVRFTERRTLAEEHHWRASQPAAIPGWNVAVLSTAHVGPAQLAPVYRALRKSYEDGKNEPGAADFYYGEMEMRRHDRANTTRTERGLLHSYWLLSGYSLRASRALGWLAAAMLATIVLLMGFGLPQDEPKQEATGTVPPGGGTVTFEIDKDHPQNPTKDRFSGERFEKALNVTFNSVVFRSSGQDLTTSGTYIEMASRVTEPILLGLAVLAVRNRVKR